VLVAIEKAHLVMAKSTGPADAGFAGNPFTKMLSEFPFMGIDLEAVLDGQRRNLAALIEANQFIAETGQQLATKQMEFARQAMQDLTAMVADAIQQPGKFEEQLGKGAVYTRQALDNACDLADRAAKSGSEVMKLINKRMGENLAEMRGYANVNKRGAALQPNATA
jgi:hypothetical protein